MMVDTKTTTFVSCIKVKGIHLLPPVITEKKRLEFQRYKQQAIKLEKRLNNCRELKKNLEDLLNFQPLLDRPQSESIHKDNCRNEAISIAKTNSGSKPFKNTLTKKINLSRDIIDVTEYNDSGIKIMSNESENKCICPNQGQQFNNSNEMCGTDAFLNKSSEIMPLTQPTKNDYLIEGYCNAQENRDISPNNLSNYFNSKDISPEKSPRPRLIRSNSYTLETPSPILLAHLEKNGKKIKEEKLVKKFCRNWSSLENNYIPFENSEIKSVKTVNNKDIENSVNKKFVSHNTSSLKNKHERCKSPTIEVIQADISVQQITVNSTDEAVKQSNEEKKFKHIFDLSDPNSQLMQVLQRIPENYSKQIIELIRKQQMEQQQKIDEFENVKETHLDQLQSQSPLKTSVQNNSSHKFAENLLFAKHGNPPSTPKPNLCDCVPKSDIFCNNMQNQTQRRGSLSSCDQIQDSIISESPSQSLYCSTTSDTVRPLSSPSVKLFDCDDRTDSEKFEVPLKTPKEVEVKNLGLRKNLNISRELFPQIDTTALNILKQKWAASVIGAHVKGYLTRRLLKTERVQSLIDTIKDALMCALQLHNAVNIDESDVELHRRLINQVSAACYAFHDIFFTLSVPEQMSMISADRQRKMEKAKRPTSAPPSSRISRSSSSRSSTKLQQHSRSLTKV